ncbi:MAG: hypothetical protein AB8G96_01360 [Phycisphaerales bacterium]
MKHVSRNLLAPAALTLAVVTAISIDTQVTANEGFSGPFTLDQWTSNGIAEGFTTVSPNTPRVSMLYDANLGNPGPGVPYREAFLSVTAADSGRVFVDWSWDGSHAFFQPEGGLWLFAENPSGGMDRVELRPLGPISNPFNFSDTAASIEVFEGLDWGIVVGGKNSDSASRVVGEIDLSNLIFCGDDGLTQGFTGPYRPSEWSVSPILEGVTALDQGLELETDAARFLYDVNLGAAGGVTYRETAWTAVPEESGILRFSWTYRGSHAFFDAEATLRLEVDGPAGVSIVELVPLSSVSKPFEFTGEIDIEVRAGFPVSIVAGGSNFDTQSRIVGEIVIENFDVDPAPSCTGDLDASGDVSFGDLLNLLSQWGSCP